MAKRLPGHTGNLLAGHDGVDHQIALVNSSGELAAGGVSASGATDSGNPVKIGGVYRATQPTLTDGQRGDLQMDTRANSRVVLMGQNSVSAVSSYTATSDAVVAANIFALAAHAHGTLFNGSTWDRQRNNTDITVLASNARTATNQSSDITNYNGRGLHLVINVTAASATPSVVFTIQGKDALSSTYYTILASAAITGTGTTVLRVFPGATAAANLAANDIIPRTWRIDATHADADSITYSVSASVIL